MAVTATISNDRLLVSLGDLQRTVANRDAALRIIGDLMYASIMRTFRDEGSPAGSWPQLAESTRKKRGYTAGHKLLILSGRLRNSITYAVSGDTLTIGTNVVYAAVHQFGSADRRGGSVGAQAKTAGRSAAVGAYDYMRAMPFRRAGTEERKDKRGRRRMVNVREQGPENARKTNVAAHKRFQNIPARPFLVFRPEDPARFVSGISAYLRSGNLPWGTA